MVLQKKKFVLPFIINCQLYEISFNKIKLNKTKT